MLDITGIQFTEEAADRVRLEGAQARPPTDSYKVTIGYEDGYIGEGEVSYGGIDAVARARWGAEIVQERLRRRGFTYVDFRVDLIGMSSLHGEPEAATGRNPTRCAYAWPAARPTGRRRMRSASKRGRCTCTDPAVPAAPANRGCATCWR